MVWGAFRSGTAGLYFLPPGSTMNGSRYVDLLKEKLEMHMNMSSVHSFHARRCSVSSLEDCETIPFRKKMWQHWAGLETAQI